ncbi:unnamed protein product [Bemisia tabaci]|uniref:UDP-glucuronosyltransferase n=1 Tax=Bemisia tabaci TaxID=7038 RepID=A0A9P0A948_BEMTA|nr:unnamed protein product [Bemisia tabaci]
MDMKLFLVTLMISCTTDAYNILIIQPGPTFSQQQPALGLAEILVKKGHNVFAVALNEVPDLGNNYTYVDLSFSYKFQEGGVDAKASKDAANVQKQMTLWEFTDVVNAVAKIPPRQFRSEHFLHFLRRVKKEKLRFDVVIGQWYFTPFVCGMARYLAYPGPTPPLISLSTTAKNLYNEEAAGSLPHPSFVPYETPYTDRMSIWQKIHNWVIAQVLLPRWKDILDESARRFFQETYGQEFASVVDGCWGNVSLMLNTGNFLHSYPRPLAPNVIEIGPLHIRKPKVLPKVLQDWLDGAEKGVIYFSLGSNMRSKSLPLDIRENLLRVFSDLPRGYRVLWKWEIPGKIPGQSDNILAQTWIPQQSVLAHPKVKVYVMQGGFQSFQEAVHYGVPIVGIPWFIDQEANVAKIVAAGIGVRLRPQELHSEDKIKEAINKVLFDESFAENMRKLSTMSHEFTSQTATKAVFWIEHVAKHGGAPHLRPSTADANYFQYFCLDLISVILITGFTASYIFVKGAKFVISMLSSKLKSKMKKS